jgi:hypothetical protein
MAKKATEWFIEPLNPETNQIIASDLRNLIEVDECLLLRDSANKEHQAYRVAHAHLTKFKKGRKTFGLKFNAWCRAGSEGIIRPWTLLDKKKPTKKDKEVADLIKKAKKAKGTHNGSFNIV